MKSEYLDNKRVVLVGPSPHLINKGMGKFIDSFDSVVRVNELGVSQKYFCDYGSRTDISFLSISEQSISFYREMLKRINIENLKLIVSPRDKFNFNPLDNSSTEEVKTYYKQLNIDVPFYQTDKPSFKEKYELFGCNPSTGALTIYELLNSNIKELYVCGFSFYLTKYRYQPERMELWKVPKQNQHGHNIRISGHDMRKEIVFLKKEVHKFNQISGDNYFKKILLPKNNLYYEVKRFVNYKLNLDFIKNLIKIFLSK